MLGLTFPWATAAKAALVLAVVAAVGLFWNHYTSLEAQVTNLTTDLAQQKQAIQIQSTTIATQSSAIDKWQKSLDDYARAVKDYGKIQANAAQGREKVNEQYKSQPTRSAIVLDPASAANRINADSAIAAMRLRCATGYDGPECSGAGAAAIGSAAPGATSAGVSAAAPVVSGNIAVAPKR